MSERDDQVALVFPLRIAKTSRKIQANLFHVLIFKLGRPCCDSSNPFSIERSAKERHGARQKRTFLRDPSHRRECPPFRISGIRVNPREPWMSCYQRYCSESTATETMRKVREGAMRRVQRWCLGSALSSADILAVVSDGGVDFGAAYQSRNHGCLMRMRTDVIGWRREGTAPVSDTSGPISLIKGT